MRQEPSLESAVNLDAAGALTRVSNKLPFLRVALSWKPSFFPLRDLDIGQNKETLSRSRSTSSFSKGENKEREWLREGSWEFLWWSNAGALGSSLVRELDSTYHN